MTIQELADYLATQEVASSSLIYLDFMPDDPDEVVVLYGNPGSAPELGFGNAGVKYENPTVQVVTRGGRLDSSTPEALAWSAFSALDRIQAQAVSGTEYLMVRPLQSPSGAVLGPDDKQRPRYSFNVAVRKELS